MKPFLRPLGYISSRFQNFEPYRENPHTGTDFVYGWKKPIGSIGDGFVYKIVGENNPDLMVYRNLYQLCDTPIGLFEICYVHCSSFIAKEGDQVLQGYPVVYEGNTGLSVFVGGVRVQAWEKPTGKGSHLHLSCRPVERVAKIEKGEHYLNTESGERYRDSNGFYYHIKNNDLNKGYVDVEQLLFTPTLSQLFVMYTKIVGFLKER